MEQFYFDTSEINRIASMNLHRNCATKSGSEQIELPKSVVLFILLK